MHNLLRLLALGLPVFSCANAATNTGARADSGIDEALDIQREQLENLQTFLGPTSDDAFARPVRLKSDGTQVTFANPDAAQFHVDGTSIPDVNFDVGDSWAGLLPISGDPNETRELFFWFWPTSNASNSDKLIFWTNGGPGCSSLEGFLQENGPWTWSWGQKEPSPNPYAWTNFGNMVWVEQPVGTGFSRGTPNITNDDQLAAQVMGFLGQFLEVFSELKGSDFYITGESYAGYYVPYIANWIYEHPGLDLNLKGIWIADPSLTHGVVQQDIPALRFVQANRNVFPFNSSFMETLQTMSDTCGYTTYLDENLKYPPTGQLPFPAGVNPGSTSANSSCRIFSQIQRGVGRLNPVFNIYRVTDTFPNLWSVLGFPRDTQGPIYFNRTDVQDAIHAPHINWEDCASRSVYIGRDTSIPSTLSVLPNVIEKSARTVIVHGLADMILIAEGTRIAIQNMTWGGLQGFQSPIEAESFHVKNMGVYGSMHQERGLTYVEFEYSGHMTPQFVPWASFQTMAYLTGVTDSPSA
jgi:carboxypeptidase D